MDHSGECHHGHMATWPDDGRFSKLNLIFGFRDRTFHRENFAMFQEQNRVIAVERVLEQAFGIVGGRRDDDFQSGNLRVHRIVVT